MFGNTFNELQYFQYTYETIIFLSGRAQKARRTYAALSMSLNRSSFTLSDLPECKPRYTKATELGSVARLMIRDYPFFIYTLRLRWKKRHISTGKLPLLLSEQEWIDDSCSGVLHSFWTFGIVLNPFYDIVWRRDFREIFNAGACYLWTFTIK
jgi:hypothetical protein